jgi:four helix bundle protein
MSGFEDLEVWERAVELSVSVYLQTNSVKDFGFRDLNTLAGLSVPSNIAEGMERSKPSDQ